VAGFDWGARTADIVAALWPERSDFDGAAADGRAYAEKFSGAYSHRVLEGIGHNVPQEAPSAFTDAILKVGGGLP
jgi:pimeloyl-ACP methyl ester carboxylesterase